MPVKNKVNYYLLGMLQVLALGTATAMAQAEPAEVRVIDGDTIEISGTIFRINGIDAPEHGQKCGNWACGNDATAAMAELVEGTRANKPVYVTYEGKEEFFVRKEGSSQPLSRAEEHEWNKGRF